MYRTCRHKDQDRFYKARHAEFERARRQAIISAGVLMFLTAMVSILAISNLFWPRWVWAVLGVIFPALSTALTAYNSLFGFEQQSKLYRDAFHALRRVEADTHDLQPWADESDYLKRVERYVEQVEEILRKEQGQWGQMISEIKPAEAFEPKHSDK